KRRDHGDASAVEGRVEARVADAVDEAREDEGQRGSPDPRNRLRPERDDEQDHERGRDERGSRGDEAGNLVSARGPAHEAVAVRDGPITPTARVNRIWLMPGAKRPVTKNAQVSRQTSPEKSPLATASAAQQMQETNVVTREAASASIGGLSARRIVTASAPND